MRDAPLETGAKARLVVANNMAMIGVAANSLQTTEMLRAFCRIGLDVSFVWPQAGPILPTLEELELRRHPLRCRIKRGGGRQVELGLRLLTRRALGGLPRAPLFTRNIGIAFAAQFGFPRVGFELHDDVSDAMRPLLRRLGATVKLLPICRSLFERLRDHEGIAPERMRVVHDGVDYDRFALAAPLPPPERPAPAGVFRQVHLYIGTLKPERGLDCIAAAARALPDHGFVLIGGTPADVAAARTRGLDLANVLVRPAVDHAAVPALLKSYDSVLAPYTRQDPLYRSRSPLKLFEYLASGTPCLVSAIGSITEVADDRVAWTFDPDHGDGLTGAIRACAAAPDQARARAERGRALVGADYTWEGRARAIYDFLSA